MSCYYIKFYDKIAIPTISFFIAFFYHGNWYSIIMGIFLLLKIKKNSLIDTMNFNKKEIEIWLRSSQFWKAICLFDCEILNLEKQSV